MEFTIQNKDGSTVKMKIDKKSPGKDTSFKSKVKSVFSLWTRGEKKPVKASEADSRDYNNPRLSIASGVEEEEDYQSLNLADVDVGDDYQLLQYQRFSPATSYLNVPSPAYVTTQRPYSDSRLDQLDGSSYYQGIETNFDMESNPLYVNTRCSRRNEPKRARSYSGSGKRPMCAVEINHSYMEKNINKESSKSHQPEKPTGMDVGRVEQKRRGKVCDELSDSYKSEFDVNTYMYGEALSTHRPPSECDREDSHECITMKVPRISVNMINDDTTDEISTDSRNLRENAESIELSSSLSFESENDDLDEPMVDRKAYLRKFYRELQTQHLKAPSEYPPSDSLNEENRASKPSLKSFRSIDSTATIDSIASDFDRVEYLKNFHQDLGKEQNYFSFERKPPIAVDYINVQSKPDNEMVSSDGRGQIE